MKPVLFVCVVALHFLSVKAQGTDRLLQAEMLGKNATYLSNECKSCIDDGDRFCPSSDLSYGFCCNATETCPQATYCSEKFQTTKIKYALCPNEHDICQHQRKL